MAFDNYTRRFISRSCPYSTLMCNSERGSQDQEKGKVMDVKPGDLTIANHQQVDDLAKAAVEMKLQKMANRLTAEDRLRIFMSSKELSLN